MGRLILLFFEFFSHHSGISDSLLSFFFGVAAFRDRFFNFSLGLLKFSFEFALLVDKSGVLSVEKVGTFAGFVELSFSEFTATFGLFNTIAEFFNFTSQKVGTTFNDSHLFNNIFTSTFGVVIFSNGILDLGLKNLNLFLSIA